MSLQRPIGVIFNYGRSGGTILARYLSRIPNIYLLSEVNPFAAEAGRKDDAPKTPYAQAKDWYGVELRHSGFRESVIELAEIAEREGKQVIIRDWTFINFESLGYSTPTNELSILKALEGQPVSTLVFVRDVIDVWISRGFPELDPFLSSYSRYLAALQQAGVKHFKYEDFCLHPEQTVRQMLLHLGVEPVELRSDLNSLDRVSGDVQFVSRGNWRSRVVPLGRRRINADAKRALRAHAAEIARINAMFGYPPEYDGVALESRYAHFVYRVMRRLKRIGTPSVSASQSES